MNTADQIAEEVVNRLYPSLAKMIELRKDSTNPEIILGRKALERKRDRALSVVKSAIIGSQLPKQA